MYEMKIFHFCQYVFLLAPSSLFFVHKRRFFSYCPKLPAERVAGLADFWERDCGQRYKCRRSTLDSIGQADAWWQRATSRFAFPSTRIYASVDHFFTARWTADIPNGLESCLRSAGGCTGGTVLGWFCWDSEAGWHGCGPTPHVRPQRQFSSSTLILQSYKR